MSGDRKINNTQRNKTKHISFLTCRTVALKGYFAITACTESVWAVKYSCKKFVSTNEYFLYRHCFYDYEPFDGAPLQGVKKMPPTLS